MGAWLSRCSRPCHTGFLTAHPKGCVVGQSCHHYEFYSYPLGEIIMNAQQYGATCAVVDGEWVITNIFPVGIDWKGYQVVGYCRPTAAEIAAAGY